MAGDENDKKPDPVDDLKKGLGLLFRAAKGAVDQLPTDKLEDVVKTGAREVGRAIENVTETIEKEVLGMAPKKKPSAPPPSPPAEAKPEEPQADAPKTGDTPKA